MGRSGTDASRAALLVRSKSTRKPPVLAYLPDSSYLSILDGLKVRIIEADLTMIGADGSHIGDRYRLITTLCRPDPVDSHREARIPTALQAPSCRPCETGPPATSCSPAWAPQ
jgi:hypothetical protein